MSSESNQKSDNYARDSQSDNHVGDGQSDNHVGDSQSDNHVGDSQSDNHVGDSQSDNHVGDSQSDNHVGDGQSDNHVGDGQSDNYESDKKEKEKDGMEIDMNLDMNHGQQKFIGNPEMTLLSPDMISQKKQRITTLGSLTSQEHGQEEPNTQLEAIEPLHQSIPLQISHSESYDSNHSQNRFQKLIWGDQENDVNQQSAIISAENSLEQYPHEDFRDRIGSSSTVDTPYDESIYSEPGVRNRLDYAKNQNAQQIKKSWSRIRMIYDNQNPSQQDPSTGSANDYPVDKNMMEGYSEVNFMKHQVKNARKASSCTTAVPSRTHSIVASNTTTMIPPVYTTTLPHATNLTDETTTTESASSPSPDQH